MAKTPATRAGKKPTAARGADPFVPAAAKLPEFTWSAILLGSLLGALFGAASVYLVLKISITTSDSSASIPVALLSLTVFRAFAKAFRLRPRTILEHNIVQTTGSAGESIALGVTATLPALLLLGHDMDLTRVTIIGGLGGLLGILLMIPFRKALVVRQHRTLTFPEGTACADVLIAGEEGGATAKILFAGFGLAFLHKVASSVLGLWQEKTTSKLVTTAGRGLPGAEFGGNLAPELLGIGYIIGPRIAAVMLAGGMLSALVLTPLITIFAAHQTTPIAPVTHMLVRDMSAGQIKQNYLLYVGVGTLTAAGVCALLRSLPALFAALRAAWSERKARSDAANAVLRTQRDVPLIAAVLGSLIVVAGLAAIPGMGLGLNWHGLLGGGLILAFGLLFVFVSARLTGEIGSSSNPITAMTVATLMLTCLIFVVADKTDKSATLSALSIAAMVCIALCNAGTTAQDLKTGQLLGATPWTQQAAVAIGTLTSTLVIGWTLVALNSAGTVYSRRPELLPSYRVPNVNDLIQLERPGSEYTDVDKQAYHVWHVAKGEARGVPAGKYLVNDAGKICYFVDPAINGILKTRDDRTPVNGKFDAPRTVLLSTIIDGIRHRDLPWGLVLIGAVLALAVELAGIPSLPFAVGLAAPIQSSVSIFCGGALRWLTDRSARRRGDETSDDSSNGVLLASGYIAGGTLAGVAAALLEFAPDWFKTKLHLGDSLPEGWRTSIWPAWGAFAGLMLVLLLVGYRRLFGGGGTPDVEPAKEQPTKEQPAAKSGTVR